MELLGMQSHGCRTTLYTLQLWHRRVAQLHVPMRSRNDEEVSKIVLRYPSIIISGHLLAAGLKVPYMRVRESLKRVDPVGAMLR